LLFLAEFFVSRVPSLHWIVALFVVVFANLRPARLAMLGQLDDDVDDDVDKEQQPTA